MTQEPRSENFVVRMQAGVAAFQRLVDAGRRLYMAGVWKNADLPSAEQAELWAELRDALGLAPGTATAHGISGVGAPSAVTGFMTKHDAFRRSGTRYYGSDDGPMPGLDHLDVELSPGGAVAAVWFRNQALPFKYTNVGIERASAMLHMYTDGDPIKLHGVEVSGTDRARRSDPKPTTLREITETPAPLDECAYGSDKHPAYIDMQDGKQMVTLGVVVGVAIQFSGLRIKQWNELSQDGRDHWIDVAINALRQSAARGDCPPRIVAAKYECTRCGKSDTEAKAARCIRSPCPMALVPAEPKS